jgi:hypothetical protein
VDRTVSKVDPIQDNVETIEIPTKAERDIDILFVIDSSPSMMEEHASLRSNFGAMLDRLDDVNGSLPNVHLGVVTSDMGTAPFNVNSQCRADGGDRGLLHGATCAALLGHSYIEDVLDEADGSRVRNYTGLLQDAFGCAADVGVDGCGFEQHLAAMQHALSPGVNPGFVRDDALLGVVILADEDDCSASDPRLYDPDNTAIGPITDFRCHTQGIVCDNDPDPSAPGPRNGCVPDPDSVYLEDVQSYVDFLVGLKGGREERVIVAGIIGDPDRVEIGPDAQGRPSVLATCPKGGLGASEPGIRFDAFLSSFGHGRRFSLCTDDLGVALSGVADVLVDSLVGGCLVNPVADVNLQQDGVQHECSVVETVDGRRDAVFPSCDVAAAPCWRIVENAKCDTEHHQQVVVDRGGAAAPDHGTLKVQCVVE